MNPSQELAALPKFLTIATIAALIGIAGCGKSTDERAAEALAPNRISKRAPPANPDDLLANAVVISKSTAAVDLKYDMATKPEVGRPVEVKLVFAPHAPADTLEVQVAGIPGLVVGNAGTPKFDKVAAGQSYSTKVTVQANQAGVYYLTVSARMITQLQTDARTFAVPLVVGTAPAPVAAGKPAAPPAAAPSPPSAPTNAVK